MFVNTAFGTHPASGIASNGLAGASFRRMTLQDKAAARLQTSHPNNYSDIRRGMPVIVGGPSALRALQLQSYCL